MQYEELIEKLLHESDKLHEKKILSEKVGPEYFEPGMMEYLDQYEGVYDGNRHELLLRFDSRGTRYSGRTEQIEKVNVGDPIQVIRDKQNPYNSNNFLLFTKKGKDVGNIPAELCNVVAPLYDNGMLKIDYAKASFVEPISKRSRHAKQAVLFVELKCHLEASKF